MVPTTQSTGSVVSTSSTTTPSQSAAKDHDISLDESELSDSAIAELADFEAELRKVSDSAKAISPDDRKVSPSLGHILKEREEQALAWLGKSSEEFQKIRDESKDLSAKQIPTKDEAKAIVKSIKTKGIANLDELAAKREEWNQTMNRLNCLCTGLNSCIQRIKAYSAKAQKTREKEALNVQRAKKREQAKEDYVGANLVSTIL